MQRKPRLKPGKPAQKPVLTDKKLDLLSLIYEMEFIRTNRIKLYIDRYDDSIARTLKLLHNEKLVRKFLVNMLSCDIYEITPKGKRYLEEHRGLPPVYVRTHVPRGKRQPEESQDFDHAMMIADFVMDIRIGAKTNSCETIPLEILENKMGKTDNLPLAYRTKISHTFGKTTSSYSGELMPDGLIGIRYPHGTVSYFALEAQKAGAVFRKTLKQGSVLRKLLAFKQAYKEGVFKNDWCLPNMRVLFFFANKSDADLAVRRGEEHMGTSPMFFFRHVPNMYETPSGFHLPTGPDPDLFTKNWRRLGMESAPIYKKATHD